MKRIYLLLTLCAVAFPGCIKYISLDVEHEVKPVLNALMYRDSILTAEVSISMTPNTAMPGLRSDAVVKLYENGTFLETLAKNEHEGKTRYVSSRPLKGGTHYRITAEVPGYPMVEGEDVIPGQVIDFTADLEKRPANGANDYFIQLKLNDPPAQRNYYRVRLYSLTQYSNSTPWRRLSNITYLGPELEDLFFGESNLFQYVFDDAMFGGRIRQLPFKTREWYRVIKFELEVSEITRDTYLFMQSAELQRSKNHHAFAEKVTVHNNIRNGLGLVGGIAIGWKELIP
ncbi:DUF4249 domain-containing protein [Chitinophaga caseinilytica]|uniref:DUF4249 domain-containing protein n=1 Tax=Chitinophaga caseinilytica TaxID=2267521 RepID=A0ABZ2ZCH2_9BACT